MNTLKKLSDSKKIAIVLNPDHRTVLIEWAFMNKEILCRHELVAAGATADCLADVLHHPVTKLTCPRFGGYRELSGMLQKNKIDVILFFGSPFNTDQQFSDAGQLMIMAMENDIVMGCNEQTIDILTNHLKKETRASDLKAKESIIADIRQAKPQGSNPLSAYA